jgi:pimeloyl-ACP methyl ester carboxylesterase/predicted glycosyltransferase
MSTIDRVGRSDTGTPARLPDEQGVVERDGVAVHWEAYGETGPAVLLLPPWSIVHSRTWKAQVPFLARHFRAITFDGRGNGLSDRPRDPAAYAAAQYVEDAVAVLDAAGVASACVVGLSRGAMRALMLAGAHPERVDGLFLISPTVPLLTTDTQVVAAYWFHDEPEAVEEWARSVSPPWLADHRGFLELFFGLVFCEPHSTKQREDAVAWGLDSTPEVLTLTMAEGNSGFGAVGAVEALCTETACPVLVVHGTEDAIVHVARGERVAELTGGELVRLEGSGHCPHGRDPIRVNLLLGDFARRVAAAPPRERTWRRAGQRPRRALFVSSPIGLGHAWRDVAIADELRRRAPGLEVHWLAQEPVTTVLEARGETIHPASAQLAGEAAHIDREAGEHDLHAFLALRRMDEILCANYMVFDELVHDEPFDLWIADEGWEIDHFLHENPERKSAPYVWLTDFVGYLPMPAGGEHEAMLTADYNAETIEHVERYPRVRDRAIFVGDAEDIVPASFGPGLPDIRAWTERHYAFAGYVPGFDPRTLTDRSALRAELGYGEEPLCLVSVGGSGVGAPLLERVIEALPLAREWVPGLRTIAVTGPRIDPASLPSADGLEVRGYVHELHRHLAACDVAVVQGGLTTTMELVAAGRPFVALPLASHFEQRFHVRHRLDRYGARSWLEYADATPDALAGAVAEAIASTPSYHPVDPGGAGRAAALIAELL